MHLRQHWMTQKIAFWRWFGGLLRVFISMYLTVMRMKLTIAMMSAAKAMVPKW
jgi:hypothetical protein